MAQARRPAAPRASASAPPRPKPTAGPPIIAARGVSKVYESGRLRVEALSGVDLEVRRGEMLAVVGPSGCGKTTLLNCLSGLDDISAGTVLLEGRDLAQMEDLERTRLRSRRMGFVFQSFNLLPVLSAVENVELPLLVSGVDPREANRRAMASLAQVGMEAFADHSPRELSGGQQQRATIARSLVNDPAIVWADEPTGNLDTKNGQEVLDLLHRLNRERGQTYVIVSHDPAIARSCHRIVHMESGRITRVEAGEGRSLPLAQERRL
ncbi:MAG: putative transport system ATP-binding protein [Thermoplasmata archaeon]|nr:putative transport system ATP-binding protein [Thermoplasmata archaeon]